MINCQYTIAGDIYFEILQCDLFIFLTRVRIRNLEVWKVPYFSSYLVKVSYFNFINCINWKYQNNRYSEFHSSYCVHARIFNGDNYLHFNLTEKSILRYHIMRQDDIPHTNFVIFQKSHMYCVGTLFIECNIIAISLKEEVFPKTT